MSNATHPGFGNTETPDFDALYSNDLDELRATRGRMKTKIREWIKTMQEAQAIIVSNIDDGCYVNVGNLYSPVGYAQRLASLMHALQMVEQRIHEVKSSA